MENNQQRKLGAGILTISIITLVLQAFAILGYFTIFFMKDVLIEQASTLGVDPSIYDTGKLIIPIVLTILIITSIILIFCKKSLGVYGYFIVTIIGIINALMTSDFVLWSFLLSLVLPALMAFFIYKRKYVFGFASKEDDLTA